MKEKIMEEQLNVLHNIISFAALSSTLFLLLVNNEKALYKVQAPRVHVYTWRNMCESS